MSVGGQLKVALGYEDRLEPCHSTRKTEANTTNGEEHALEVVELVLRELQEARVLVDSGTSGSLVLLECIACKKDEGSSGVNDTSGLSNDCLTK